MFQKCLSASPVMKKPEYMYPSDITAGFVLSILRGGAFRVRYTHKAFSQVVHAVNVTRMSNNILNANPIMSLHVGKANISVHSFYQFGRG